MRVSAFFAFIASFLLMSVSHASYFISTKTGEQIGVTKRTHILFSGRGNDLGMAPEFASAAKAAKIAEANPSDQVVLITILSSGVTDSESTLRRYGFGNIVYKQEIMDSVKMMDVLSRFTQIASFHAYGHSGIVPGVYLDGVGSNDLKWTAYDPQSQRLVGHFTPDAYVTLNGCNAGHLQGPILSKMWGVPVAASLTSTHFESQYKDGNFYWMDEQHERQNMMPNYISTIRMRPDNNNYHGHLGKYQQGLPFFKFFCAGISNEKCLSGMANSMRALVSVGDVSARPTLDQYLSTVREWLCPSGIKQGDTTQMNCMATLARMTPANADRTFSPFSGHLAHCDFNGCYSNTCEASAASASACASGSPREVAPSTTFVDEYLNYMKAFPYVSVGATSR